MYWLRLPHHLFDPLGLNPSVRWHKRTNLNFILDEIVTSMINTLGGSFVTCGDILVVRSNFVSFPSFLLANMVRLKVIVKQISAYWKIDDVLPQMAA